jgi:hypothetical protein
MSEAALPRVERLEWRPLGATTWFVWMAAMWAAFLVLLAGDRIDGVWSWVRDLPLVAELVLWVALFPGCVERPSGRVPGPARCASSCY